MKKLFQLPFTNVFIFSILWALDIIIAKLAFSSGAHPVTFIIQANIVRLLFLAVIVLPRKIKEIKAITPDVLKGIVIGSIIHFSFGAVLSNSGIALTTAINAGFLMKFTLFTTLFFAWLLLKEKMTIPKTAAALFSFIGVFLLTTQGRLISPEPGDILILLACISWSLGNVFLRKVLKSSSVSGETVSLLRPIIGLPLIILFISFSSLLPPTLQAVFTVNIANLSYLNYVIVAGLSGAFLSIFLYRTLKVASASYLTMMTMMTPVFVSLIALTVLKETMMPIQIAGALLIIISGFVTHQLKIAKQ